MLNLPVARTYQFKLGQGEPKATWKDLELAAVQLPKISGNSRVELAKAPVDPAIPLGLHQSMKSYPPPPFFLDRAKGIKQTPQVPTSLNFPPHSLASMLYTSYLIAPFPSDGTALMSSNLPAGHPMDWFAPPQTIPSCLEIESKQTSSPSPPFGVLKVSAADPIDWALTVRKSHEINSELGLGNPEVEDLPPWKYESEMEFDVGAEWP
ncbi:hypothetical protein BDV93DRAFT_525089 [Ceratobasidium sp. AG-I]|nr:hypothetical protein BDV93DRAFT_525089 [Ceratobasidium sp. AG-I]